MIISFMTIGFGISLENYIKKSKIKIRESNLK